MANKTIYIPKDVEEILKDEPNVSGLFSKLLREYAQKIGKQVDNWDMVGIRSKVSHDVIETTDGYKLNVVATPNQEDVDRFQRKIAGNRTMADVIAEVHIQEQERDNALDMCQDPETSAQIRKKYEARLSSLWIEHRQLKGIE